jgi:tetratricopeptide (TPR) repeat protein
VQGIAPPGVAAATPGLPHEVQDAAATEARLALVAGDDAAAAQRWRAILDRTATPASAREARFNLALSLALDGRGTEALDVLAHPSPEPDPREDFVRGVALDAANQHATGMQSLATYAAANPTVAPAVWLEVAQREQAAGRARESADAAARGLEPAPSRPLQQHLLEVRSQALAVLGDTQAAFDAHRQVLALATSTATLGEQLYRLAQVSRDLNQPAAAVQALQTALERFFEVPDRATRWTGRAERAAVSRTGQPGARQRDGRAA